MIEFPVYSIEGKEVGKIPLKEDIFAYPSNENVVYEYVKMYLANRRKGTASTRTRGEIRGGGKKPFSQKHTGRARAGSVRSPLWKGGGVVFGPSPRDYSYTISKKKKKIAFYSVLSSLRKEGKIKILKDLNLKEVKTKEIKEILERLNIQSKILLVIDNVSEDIKRAARNLKEVRLRDPLTLNPYEILCAEWLVFTEESLHKLEEVRI